MQRIVDPKIGSSNLPTVIIATECRLEVSRLVWDQEIAGSIPASRICMPMFQGGDGDSKSPCARFDSLGIRSALSYKGSTPGFDPGNLRSIRSRALFFIFYLHLMDYGLYFKCKMI